MRAFNILLSVLVSIVLAVLVLEGGLRLIGLGPPPPTINQFDAKLGWSKKPGAVGRRKTDEFDVTYVINSQGLRDDEPPTSKPEGVYGIVMLGDSFTLGYTVERHDLFVDQLEKLWQSQGRNVDVINAGTEGWSTDQEVAWLLENGEALQPDMVVLVAYENDLYLNGKQSYGRFPKPRFTPDGQLETRTLEDPGPEPWWKRTAIGRLIDRETAGPETFEAEPGVQLYEEWAAYLKEPPPFMVDALARTRGALLAAQRECQRLGAELIVVPIPNKAAVHEAALAKLSSPAAMGRLHSTAWSVDQPVETFLELSHELGIATLDPRPALKRAAAKEGSLYYQHDWHFNPAGNHAFAEFLAESLDGRFPESHRALRPGSFPVASTVETGLLPTWAKTFLALWLVLSVLYAAYYRDEPTWLVPLKIAAMLAMIFAIFFGLTWLVTVLPPRLARLIPILFLTIVLGFVAYKMGRKVTTIAELFKSFTLRGHWYLMPLVVVLLTIGSLLVVAASSPLVAPFIYTLF